MNFASSFTAGGPAPVPPEARPVTGDRQSFALAFIALPLGVGLVMGINRVAFAQQLSVAQAILFWVGMSFLVWTALYVSNALLLRICRGRNVPLTLISAVAATAASFPMKPVVYWYADMAARLANNGSRPRDVPSFGWSISYFEAHFTAWSGVIALWIISNLLFRRMFSPAPSAPTNLSVDEPAMRPGAMVPPTLDEPDRTSLSSAALAFRKRLGDLEREEILALSSEDHFVRVHLPGREALIYGRLSDAIDAMGGIAGLRVHRSHWVSRAAISELRSNGGVVEVQLISGACFPVSRSYRETLRRSGLAAARAPEGGSDRIQG